MANVKASFDVTTVAGQMKVFNAQNGASISLKTLDNGAVISATGVLQYEEKIESYGKEQDATVTVIFAEDGTSYAGVSDTVAKAGDKLIAFLSATGLEQFNVKVIKQKSGKGNEFLNIQLV
jgi:glyceraldehyde-3-phosphate dehydrogenase/erythrose-4-phosphate dehydrogenase